jgi:hypothetical protein
MSDSNETNEKGFADQIRDNVALVAKAAHIEPPAHVEPRETTGELPVVRYELPVSHQAREIGMILADVPIFRRGEKFVTAEKRGELEPMTPYRFLSWVEDYLYLTKPKGNSRVEFTMTLHSATAILASDQFKEEIREIKEVNKVRLPAWRGESEAKTSISGPFWLEEGSDFHVELLPPGYDKRTQIYTTDTVKFRDDLPLEDAKKFLGEIVSEFHWASEPEIGYTRSLGVHYAAMLGVFCKTMFLEGTIRPMIIYSGNRPGIGKSLAMQMALAPINIQSGNSGNPKNDGELGRKLDTYALEKRPFLVMDDIAGLDSPDLNRFITSRIFNARILSKSETKDCPNRTQAFASGNNLKLTPDLVRRSMVVDFFWDGETPKYEKNITTDWLALPKTMSDFLAALWAIVREWNAAGRPESCCDTFHSSASEWAPVIGAIVHFLNPDLQPFAKRSFGFGGDESGFALKEMLRGMAANLPNTGGRFSTNDFLDRAEELDLGEIILDEGREPKRNIGRKLEPLRSTKLTDDKGRVFKLQHRRSGMGAVYEFVFEDS